MRSAEFSRHEREFVEPWIMHVPGSTMRETIARMGHIPDHSDR